jgi:hypothetical protein
MMHSRRILRALMLAASLFASLAATRAAVSVSFDAETLNALLPALAPEEVAVSLGGNPVRLRLTGLKVTGFEPAAAGGATGRILTSLRIQSSQLKIDLPAEPKLWLDVATDSGKPEIVLHFEHLVLPMLGASIDVAGLIPPMRFPVGGAFAVEAARGPVQLEGRVTAVNVGARYVRIDFDLRPAAR